MMAGVQELPRDVSECCLPVRKVMDNYNPMQGHYGCRLFRNEGAGHPPGEEPRPDEVLAEGTGRPGWGAVECGSEHQPQPSFLFLSYALLT